MATKMKVSDEANDTLRPEDMQTKTKVTPKPMPKPMPKPKSKVSDEANDTLRPEDMQAKKFKSGGAVKSKIDGCAVKGKTRGKYC
tara:strand:- start:846 stop:1100 length:255 start_codon:yes stop_codon:yes gene_type:complete